MAADDGVTAYLTCRGLFDVQDGIGNFVGQMGTELADRHSHPGEALANMIRPRWDPYLTFSQRSSPKDLMQKVQRLFPKASKKQVIRVAFAQMIERAEEDVETSRVLQDFAISERNAVD